MMRDGAYYQKNFQQNTSPISRDVYIENKVKSVMESFLSDVTFYSSVHYKIVEDEVEKNPELDILGVSDKAVYIIEVKAHELSYKTELGWMEPSINSRHLLLRHVNNAAGQLILSITQQNLYLAHNKGQF